MEVVREVLEPNAPRATTELRAPDPNWRNSGRRPRLSVHPWPLKSLCLWIPCNLYCSGACDRQKARISRQRHPTRVHSRHCIVFILPPVNPFMMELTMISASGFAGLAARMKQPNGPGGLQEHWAQTVDSWLGTPTPKETV